MTSKLFSTLTLERCCHCSFVITYNSVDNIIVMYKCNLIFYNTVGLFKCRNGFIIRLLNGKCLCRLSYVVYNWAGRACTGRCTGSPERVDGITSQLSRPAQATGRNTKIRIFTCAGVTVQAHRACGCDWGDNIVENWRSSSCKKLLTITVFFYNYYYWCN